MERIESYKVTQWTKDECRYCFARVREGDSLYRADDGDVCFECADKNYGPFCRCGEPCGAEQIRCAGCSEKMRAA